MNRRAFLLGAAAAVVAPYPPIADDMCMAVQPVNWKAIIDEPGLYSLNERFVRSMVKSASPQPRRPAMAQAPQMMPADTGEEFDDDMAPPMPDEETAEPEVVILCCVGRRPKADGTGMELVFFDGPPPGDDEETPPDMGGAPLMGGASEPAETGAPASAGRTPRDRTELLHWVEEATRGEQGADAEDDRSAYKSEFMRGYNAP